MSTLKTGSTLTTGTAVGDTQPGMTITFGSTAGAGVQGFQVTDYLNAPIFAVPKASNGQIAVYGDYFGAYYSITTDVGIKSDGKRNPAALWMTDGTAMGMRIWSGTGAPSATTVNGPASPGDLYIRIDTPSTSNQRVYQCTAGGSPGTWVGRL